MSVFDHIDTQISGGKKLFAVLIDPEGIEFSAFARLVNQASQAHVDLFLLGGSNVSNDIMSDLISHIKQFSHIPCLIFPGDITQIDTSADALLFLSLISGRNPEYLIGKHVEAAALLKKSELEIISTGYILIDGGSPSAVSYVSQTLPIPRNQTNIAVATAIAGEMLGLKCIYLEAGSGARKPIPVEMVSSVKKNINIPLLVGGGIKSAEYAQNLAQAGADIIVVGNAVEKDPELMFDLSSAVHAVKSII